MKYWFILLFITGSLLAIDGPIFKHDQPYQREFEDIYKNLNLTNSQTATLGEYISSTTASTSFTTSGQYADYSRITLTDGDWDITAVVVAGRSGATWDTVLICISTTPGNTDANCEITTNYVPSEWASSATTPNYITINIPNFRVSISAASQTYYTKLRASYSVGTPVHYTRLSARRKKR